MTHETKDISGYKHSHNKTVHDIFKPGVGNTLMDAVKHTVRGRYTIRVYPQKLEIVVQTYMDKKQ